MRQDSQEPASQEPGPAEDEEIPKVEETVAEKTAAPDEPGVAVTKQGPML